MRRTCPLIRELLLCASVLGPSVAVAHDYSGHIEGRALTEVQAEQRTVLEDLYIADIRVELVRQAGNQVIAWTATDDLGHFDLSWDEEDGAGSWDLFLRFVATNEAGTIRVVEKSGWTAREEEFLPDNGAPYLQLADESWDADLGDITLDAHELRPQLLHWANRARQFVETELQGQFAFPPNETLDIATRPWPATNGTAFFFPGDFRGEIKTVLLEMAGLGTVAGATLDLIFSGLVEDLTLAGAIVNHVLVPAIAATTVDAWVEREISNNDAIYIPAWDPNANLPIDEIDELDENLLYHEFGHFLMWHLQGESWANPIDGAFAHHSIQTNSNPKIAFNEGFANSFSMIMDTWAHQLDAPDPAALGAPHDRMGAMSGRYYEATDPAASALPFWGGFIAAFYVPEAPNQNNTSHPCAPGGFPCNNQSLTHGFLSEWSIATAIYDLWDGETSFAVRSDAPPGSPTVLLPREHEREQAPQGHVIDPVSLPFAEIVRPLLEHQGTGGFHCAPNDMFFLTNFTCSLIGMTSQEQLLVKNVVEYHAALRADADVLGPDITEVFTRNNVRNLHVQQVGTDFYPQGLEMVEGDFLNSDDLAFTGFVLAQLVELDANDNWVPTTTHGEAFEVSIRELIDAQDDYNYIKVTPEHAVSAEGRLSDPLTIGGEAATGGATLFLNGGPTPGFQNPANNYAQMLATAPVNTTQFDVTIAPGTTVEVLDSGTLEIGEFTGNRTAAHGGAGRHPRARGGADGRPAGAGATPRQASRAAGQRGPPRRPPGLVRVHREGGGAAHRAGSRDRPLRRADHQR